MDKGKLFLHCHLEEQQKYGLPHGHVIVDHHAWLYAYEFFQRNPQYLPENNKVIIEESRPSAPDIHYVLITYQIDREAPITTAVKLINGYMPIHYIMNKRLETKKTVALLYDREISYALYCEINEFEDEHGH